MTVMTAPTAHIAGVYRRRIGDIDAQRWSSANGDGDVSGSVNA